jgi:hypothetical protein
MFRKDRKTNGGGLILYVNENFSGVPRNDLQNEDIESIWLEI